MAALQALVLHARALQSNNNTRREKKTEVKLNKLIKLLVFLTLLILIILFFILDLGDYFKLSYIKGARENLLKLYNDNPAAIVITYMLIYIAATALSLPGAAALTIAGGAVFGFTVGLAAVSFASTIGATLACVVSRYLLRDWVQNRFGEKLAAVNQGIEEEGAFYLFSLRLVPLFPFFVINLLMGLTRMRLFTFYWVSQLGMLAGTAVYINAGNELGKLESLSGILSPGLIISFILLGLFPLIVKRLLGFYKKKFSGETQN